MGLFCGNVCECKRRCKSWFSGMPSLEDACKNACKVKPSIHREDFLCSGNYVDQRNVMLQYGYDPCLGDDTGFDDTLAGQSVEQQNLQWERIQPIIIGLAILIAAGLAILYVSKR